MIWERDIYKRNELNEKLIKQFDRAVEYRKRFISNEYLKTLDDNDFIAIMVEGYLNVTFITNEFTPIEIAEEVIPFDENKIYPLQRIEMKIHYKTY